MQKLQTLMQFSKLYFKHFIHINNLFMHAL